MPRRIPSYRHYKPKNLGLVVLDGTYYYLGKYGTPESLAEYNRVIQEWLANKPSLPQAGLRRSDLTINELLLAFWKHAEEHYRSPEGTPTGELDNFKDALKPLRKLYGATAAREFGPLGLRTVQQAMVKAGLCRTTVNARVKRIRRVFKWAVSVELLSPTVYQALQTVQGLRRGRGGAKEPRGTKPVPEEHVLAVLPSFSTPIRAMTELQLLTGCRAGEVMIMRAIDLDRTKPIWVYRPGRHKNEHRGLERLIFLGPRAQEILQPFLQRDPHAYLFRPCDVVEQLHARRRAQRKTRRTPSELARRRREKPQVKAGERYTRRSYRQAILRACRKAEVPPWSPLQLRHTAATRIRAEYGLEAAKVILGHSKIETSQIYAERDFAEAERIMGEIG